MENKEMYNYPMDDYVDTDIILLAKIQNLLPVSAHSGFRRTNACLTAISRPENFIPTLVTPTTMTLKLMPSILTSNSAPMKL